MLNKHIVITEDQYWKLKDISNKNRFTKSSEVIELLINTYKEKIQDGLEIEDETKQE